MSREEWNKIADGLKKLPKGTGYNNLLELADVDIDYIIIHVVKKTNEKPSITLRFSAIGEPRDKYEKMKLEFEDSVLNVGYLYQFTNKGKIDVSNINLVNLHSEKSVECYFVSCFDKKYNMPIHFIKILGEE